MVREWCDKPSMKFDEMEAGKIEHCWVGVA